MGLRQASIILIKLTRMTPRSIYLGAARGRPLAEPGPPLVRRWNTWDIEILTAQCSDRRRTSLAATAGEPTYPLRPHFAGPRQGLAGGCAPSDPPNGNGT